MAHFSTGLGLAVLGGCILGAAAISSHRLGGEAFAQGTGTERRIVSANTFPMQNAYNGDQQVLIATRVWSDNVIEARVVGRPALDTSNSLFRTFWLTSSGQTPWGPSTWQTLDNGTNGFRPLTDVDMSGEVDGGDISQVLLDFNTRSDDLPPPPIDCTINAPR
jgi:hypothetical protein